MRIAIGIPTLGRARILEETVRALASQTRRPDRLVICCSKPEDASPATHATPGVEVVFSERGLARQRNRIIDVIGDCDLVLFLDDDFILKPDYIAIIERLFETRPAVVVATGEVVADGINGRGLTMVEAQQMLAADEFEGDPLQTLPVANGYGCNMAIRLDTPRRERVRFDERLPLYGWQEDAEYSCRLAPYGEIVRVAGARGVHLGTKASRSSGVQLGYSQVINPLYIARRVPAYTYSRAVAQTGRNLVANLLRTFWPEPWVDRRGRLHGNILGLRDVARGLLDPERVLGISATRLHSTMSPANAIWPPRDTGRSDSDRGAR